MHKSQHEFSICSILAIIYYLRVAWTNPGYIMGSVHDPTQWADAYDQKVYSVENQENNNDSSNFNLTVVKPLIVMEHNLLMY